MPQDSPTPGLTNLAAIFAGKQGIADAAFNDRAQSITKAQLTQATTAEKIQQAVASARQNAATLQIGQKLSGITGRDGNPIMSPELIRSVAGMFQAGATLPQIADFVEKTTQTDRANRIEGFGVDDPNISPMNAAILAASPPSGGVATLTKVGDLITRGNLGDNPTIDQTATAQNTAAGASVSSARGRGEASANMEAEIAAFMNTINRSTGLPHTRTEATLKATSNITTKTDIDQFGNVVKSTTNQASETSTAEAVPITSNYQKELVAPAPADSLYQNMVNVAGPAARFGHTIEVALDVLGVNTSSSFARNRAKFKIAQKRLITSLQNNQRSTGEFKMLEKLIEMGPAFWDDPAQMGERALGVDTELRTIMMQDQQQFNDPQTNPTTKKGLQDEIAALESYLVSLQVPDFDGNGQPLRIPPRILSIERDVFANPGYQELANSPNPEHQKAAQEYYHMRMLKGSAIAGVL